MDREQFSRNSKRLRLQKEWEEELKTNDDYKCQKCKQYFYQPLSDEIEKICPICENEHN